MATPTTLPASFVSGAVLTASQMNNLRGAFRVLQVVQTVKTNTFSSASTTYTDVTGLTATITPSSTSSKVLVVAQFTYSQSYNPVNRVAFRINGGNASNYVGDTAGSRIRAAVGFVTQDIWRVENQNIPITLVYLDSPATTSATTYAVQGQTGAGTFFVNQSSTDTDATTHSRTASSITVMEISA